MAKAKLKIPKEQMDEAVRTGIPTAIKLTRQLEAELKARTTPGVEYSPTKFTLNPKQKLASTLFAKPQRHTQLEGGSRSGKTTFIVRAILMRAYYNPGSRHAILRFRGNAVRASIGEDTLPKVIANCFPELNLTPHKQAGYYELPNGSQIWLGGLDEQERVEKILGQEFATMYFNETSQIPYQSVVIALTRLAQNVTNPKTKSPLVQRAYYDLNPPPMGHWTHTLFHRKLDPVTKKPLEDPENYEYLVMNPVDNKENLTKDYLRSLELLPERARKRFYYGLYSDDSDTALWTIESIEKSRVKAEDVPAMKILIVAVDPSGADEENDLEQDEIGVVVAGVGEDGHGYVMKDYTLLAGPQKWGTVAVTAYQLHRADRIIGETNYGGAMVRFVIKTVDASVPFKEVTASRGKHQRAEPVASLFTQNRCHIVGYLPELEDELTAFSSDGYNGTKSPNRADAMIWALTDLLINDAAQQWIDHYGLLAQKAHTGVAPPQLSGITLTLNPSEFTADGEFAQVKANEITQAYTRTLNELTKRKVVSACRRCGGELKPGDTIANDGLYRWHLGCYHNGQ